MRISDSRGQTGSSLSGSDGPGRSPGRAREPLCRRRRRCLPRTVDRWGWVVKEEDGVHARRVAHGVNILQTMSGLVGENSLVLCLQFPHDLIGGRLSVDLVVFHAHGKEGAPSVRKGMRRKWLSLCCSVVGCLSW
jgi:hypothetical protein